MFNDVQDILNGRKRKALTSQHGLREEFLFRVNLLCKQCGRLLTASTSKGNGGLYYYYHCTNGCKERFHSKEVNEAFDRKLITYKANENAGEYNRAVLLHYLNIDVDGNTKRIKQMQAEIQRNKEMINTAREKVLNKI